MYEEIIQNFHFIRAYWLWALIPLFLGVWLWRYKKAYSHSWQTVCDKNLLPFILGDAQGTKAYLMTFLLMLTGILSILAIAGPTWTKLPQPVFRQQSALVIVLDLSLSMDAADIKPSRLTRARLKIIDILKKRKEGQTALLVFAEEAFIVSPLTEDSKTIESMVNSLSTDLMPSQGSYVNRAIRKAEDLFKQAGVNRGDILLITDGGIPNNVSVEDAVPTQSSYRLSVLGIGTEDGAPIPVKNGSFLKDSVGAIVIPKLKENKLRQLADLGGGRYRRLTVDDADINYLIPDIDSSISTTNLKSEDELKLNTDIWQEEGPWLLLLIIPVVAFAFRRGVIAVLVILCFPFPSPSYAFEWADLWSGPNQRGAASFKKGEHEKAAAQFKNPEWQAAAYYNNQEFEKVLEKLENIQTADGLYNKGNALAKLGKLPEAIQTYEETLKLSPTHEDAIYNKKLLEDALQKQNKDNENSQESEKGDSNEDSESDSQQSGQESDKQSGESSQDDSQQDSQSSSGSDDTQKDTELNEEQKTSDASPEQDKAEEDDAKKAMKENQKQTKDAQEKSDQDDELSKELQYKAELSKANEQWLKRIPDDPGGLLRRKFKYQSKIQTRSSRKEYQNGKY